MSRPPRKDWSRNTIRAYWAQTDLWQKKGYDSPQEFLEASYCFACGIEPIGGVLERAHIQARCEGGADRPENIHLLCHLCHRDSESLIGEGYWSWFYARSYVESRIASALASGFITMADIRRAWMEDAQRGFPA